MKDYCLECLQSDSNSRLLTVSVRLYHCTIAIDLRLEPNTTRIFQRYIVLERWAMTEKLSPILRQEFIFLEQEKCEWTLHFFLHHLTQGKQKKNRSSIFVKYTFLRANFFKSHLSNGDKCIFKPKTDRKGKEPNQLRSLLEPSVPKRTGGRKVGECDQRAAAQTGPQGSRQTANAYKYKD